ncbi:MAG: class I SAM-dependent methyltransferase, partial [Rhodospirillales bacterium]
VDLAAALIEKCAADPDLAAIEFRVANIIDLSELGSFDAITCNAVTYLLDWDDYSRALKSIYAALRPGGRYVGFELANPFSVQDLTIVETSEWNPAGLVLRVRPIARVEKAFHEAGFASVDFHEFTMPIDLPFPGYDADVVTYTRKDESGKRLSFRGAFFQPWYHIVATKPA